MSFSEREKQEINGRSGSGTVKILLVLLLLAAGAYFGRSYLFGESGGQAPQATAPRAPQAPVVVLHRVERADLAVGREYVGRVEPIQTVSLRPQVSGEIEQVHFKEGSMVKAGQLLFTIDARQYKTTVALRKAELAKAEANYDRAVKYDRRLKAADSRSVSASDIEQSESDVLQRKAEVEQARATLQLAQIDLDYTRVTAPISGQAGKAFFTKGNYVTPSSGPLTTIVQMDPIRVTFSLPDRDYLAQLAAFRSSEAVYDAAIRLPDGGLYPEKGLRDFESNVMDEETGTLTVSLRFPNGDGTLVPGSMVRVEARPARSRVVAVVPQEAIMADGEGDFVYVVDEASVAHRRPVSLGDVVGKVSVVLSGLEPGERIVLLGLQSVVPEGKVAPVEATNGKGGKTPAELAQESDFDLETLETASPDRQAKDVAGGSN
ncbi:efflux RND transporter periplasmic adaptor subunit [Aminirod propionatiphilus]|uniref:Efflux RND transporter periplasmic adaptor subunit n=1 Tax=Aminirod propionatiphilus TaxID=3415223 RepID=A0ACD1DV05_9BACT|nr:efflux RND transporter periplasmic adaptor subunit [Synergistota bacterium]